MLISVQKDFEITRARINGKSEPREDTSRSKSETAPTKAKGPRARDKAKQKTSNAPDKDQNWWEAAAIFEFIQKAVNQNAIRVHHVNMDKVATLIVRRYEIDEVEVALNVIKVHAANLCYMMEHPRRSSQYMVHEPIYEELRAGHDLSATETRRAESIELRPRKDHATLKNEVSDEDSESSSEAVTPVQRRRPNRGKYSGLRPKSGKFSGKGKSVKMGKGKGKAYILTNDDSGEEEEIESEMEIDTPTHAISPGKRKSSSEDLEVETGAQLGSKWCITTHILELDLFPI